MKAISLFSGVGGFDLGFDRTGIETVLQAESDPWCLSVLARHWPHVERVTDVRNVGTRTAGASSWLRNRGRDRARCAVDLVYGGWPCQGNSVAGKRAGLSDERSGLWHEVRRVLCELRPRWFVGENVPGLLSVNRGLDFLRVLMDLDELGYGVAWRIVDGRFFGVPQRRRRVLIVGCLGDTRRAAQVLAVCESCGGHPAPRRETREDIAPTLDDGARRASVELSLIAASLRSRSSVGNVHMPRRGGEDDQNLIIGSELDPGSMRPLTARSTGYRMDYESENFIVAGALRASDGHHGHSSPRGDGADNLIAFHQIQDPIHAAECSPALGRKSSGMGISSDTGVRRLTPLECERLMAWPDEHTRWTVDGQEIPDSHRYRMCGNGIIATVAQWLGWRLMRADQFVSSEQ